MIGRPPAIRPEDVRINHADGTVTIVELAYAGFDDGSHVWEAATPVTEGDRVYVGVLPPHTSISFFS